MIDPSYKRCPHFNGCSIESLINDFPKLTESFEEDEKEENQENIKNLSDHDELLFFFGQLSQYWSIQDTMNLLYIFNEVNEKSYISYDISFKDFGIAEYMMQTFQKSDDPPIIISLLDFILVLIRSDKQYIYDFMKTETEKENFICSLYGVHRDIESCDCLVRTLKCATIFAKCSPDIRDAIYSVFQVPNSNSELMKKSEILYEFILLLSAYLSYPINDSKIITKMCSTLFFIVAANADFHLSDVYYPLSLCVAYLRFYPEFREFSNQKHIINLFIEFLFDGNKSVVKNSLLALEVFFEIADNEYIKNFKLQASLVNCLLNKDGNIIVYACDTLITMIFHSGNFVYENLRLKIINLLMETVSERNNLAKCAMYRLITVFFYVYPEYIMNAVNCGLYDILQSMLELESGIISIEALLLLDAIFSHEKSFESESLLVSFKEKGGMELVHELMNLGDEEQVARVEWFLRLYDSTIEEVDDLNF